ncbi:MAG: hypothetical protein MUC50_14535, partial [Myxococcota bacterium]|nr:hypothetical protein [Myxococcota bacterium]
WTPTVNTTFSFGHSQAAHKTIHANLTRVDRTIFQWSSGGYFHPDVADDTTWLVDTYNLENNHHFDMFKSIPNLPDDWSNGISKIGATFSRSSSLSEANIKIYKNAGSVLTSIDNYFFGYKGYQQWPWAATADDIAVWTQSGNIKEGWVPASSQSANSHLPRVQQDRNVAMIKYFPNIEIRTAQWLGEYDTAVFLYWPTNRFDESIESGRWIIGRKGDSYVAVYRHGTSLSNGFYHSTANRGRQVWAVVVGNKATHQSFSNFTNIIKKAVVNETYKFDWSEFENEYRTSIEVDGKTLYSET